MRATFGVPLSSRSAGPPVASRSTGRTLTATPLPRPLRGEPHPTCYRPIRGGSPTGPPPGPARRSVWTMSIDWNEELAEQLDWHWRSHLRPRFDGLTDEEYFWEPVPGMWSVRPHGTSTTPVAVGGGAFTQDFAWPEPVPAPVTTIAWRLSHLLVGVFGMRVASHFGGEPVGYDTYDYPGDAATALARLDKVYAEWLPGGRGPRADGAPPPPRGPAEGPFAEASMAALVLHINRETLHHGAEIALLRDLFRWQPK